MGNLNFSHGGNIYAVKRFFKKEFIDFSANINPLGLPRQVKEALTQNFAEILHYPDPQAQEITCEIARYWGIGEENIILGNGSIELIYLVVSCYNPKTIAIAVPTFSEYERAAKGTNSKIAFLKLNAEESFQFKIPEDYRRPDIIFLGNPNNPTGNLILEDSPAAGNLAKELAVVDEAFMDFVPDEKHKTLIQKAARDKKIIVLRTFTKFFALPGLRLGYAISHGKNIKRLKSKQPPWSVNSLAQIAAKSILKDKGYIASSRKFIGKEREFLIGQLKEIPELKIYPSVVNFLLIKIQGKDFTSSLLKKKLIQRGILIRDCANFRGLSNKFIRIAVRSRRENAKLIKALNEVV